ncbi:tubulin polyglutamylase TTLL13 [Calliphora vicina]|uniref:tubulin polyglutamylase TTLL13 n=1 Tax=Calliphora vicina TaxID=7373 RepID=UPI00325B434A
MILKKSKFFKRIQMLRHISKEKLRKERERKRIECHLESVFCETSGTTEFKDDAAVNDSILSTENCCETGVDKVKIKNKLKFQQRKYSSPSKLQSKSCNECGKVNGLIHLNNTCYQVECLAGASNKNLSDSTELMPSVSATRCSICVCNSRYNLIGRIAKSLGFKVVKENKRWNILWTDSLPGVEIYKNMKRFQQINHYPGMMEICRKDLLSRNLNRMLKLYPKDYKIFPKTWIFPADYGEALNYANNHNKQKMFIIKPDAGAQGRGIWLTNDLKSVSTAERMICQTYISKPLLIDGYKFDLRVYALITSVDPLRIFVYNEGLARLATNKYVEPSMDNSDNLYMHLTNYSVNKKNSQYESCDSDDCGSKRNFGAINSWMRRQNYDVKGFWDRIDDIIIKTILSAWPILKHNYHACFPSHDKIQACFEILGFDILVDSKMKPYVLEVNHSPSFHTNELVDLQVKRPLIRDTLSLIGTVLADKRQILREDRKRIKQRLLKTKPASLSQSYNAANINTLTDKSLHNTTIECPGSLSKSYNVTNISTLADKSLSNTTIECPVSAIAQQIAWEESHLGDYRRIMPPNDPHKLNYYCQFYGQLNQSSIFADTASSKKREEVSKKLRKDLEEKKQKQTEMFKRKVGDIKFEDRQRRRLSIPRIIAEKQRQELIRSQAHWAPDFISAAEERLRVTYMQMRAEILKEFKVTEMIYTMLYNAGCLTKADIVKFPNLHRSLEGGSKIYTT